ncbi:hypothetical protein JCM21900_004960 [Sporobolomyces salmonicolor]
MLSFPASFTSTRTALRSSSTTSLFALVHSPPTASNDCPILVFLHGYPQNHLLFAPLLTQLAQEGVLDKFRVIVPDLPGYGQSRKPASPDGSHLAHSKHEVGKDIAALVDELFGTEAKMVLIGHDRGARVAYRMAKDSRSRVAGLCVMDIIPTKLQFQEMSYDKSRHAKTLSAYHWILLALPPPLPETLISSNPSFYIRHTIDSWAGSRFKGKFDEDAMRSWTEQYRNEEVVTGALEDYRAGISVDLDHDEADERTGKERVDCPVLALWSEYLAKTYNVGKVWEALGPLGGVEGRRVGDGQTGHFVPLEATAECVESLKGWLVQF